MRSRYCAAALGLVDYMVATTDPAGPRWEADETAWRASLELFCANTRFVGLRILETAETGDQGMVHFHASLEQAGQPTPLIERSQFRRVDGRWLYTSGEVG